MSLTFPHYGFVRSTAPEQRSSSLQKKSFSSVIAQMTIAEFVTVALCGYLVTWSYHQLASHTWPRAALHISSTFGIATIELFVVVSSGHYQKLHEQSKELFCLSGLGALILAFCVFISSIYVLALAQEYSRGALILQLIITGAAVFGLRAICYSRLHLLLTSGKISIKRVALIGSLAHCLSIAARLRSAGIHIVRSFEVPKTLSKHSPELVSFIDDLVSTCRNIAADDVVILTDTKIVDFVAELARALGELPVNVQVVPNDIGIEPRKIVPCGPLCALRLYERPLTAFNQCVKRTLDIVVSVAGFLLLFPVFVLTAILIKLDSHGPVFFSQTRHGYNNLPFRVLKFRTMSVREDGYQFTQARKNDPRITRVGKILRRTSIDELPQLYNVLIGEMSIVGPRPHAVAHNYMFNGLIALFWRRHTVKPGITGLAQVNGCRGETDTLEKMQKRIAYDLQYIEHWSLALDLKIILMTIISRASRLNAH